MRKMRSWKYGRATCGEPRMKLCVLLDCCGEGVEAWGKLETWDHTGTHPRMEESGSICQGMEQGVVCRGEGNWVSGSKVGGGGRRWKQANPKTDGS
jgi:hypothetical protein